MDQAGGRFLALCLAWLAIAQARVIGINFLLSVLLVVWATDIFAYFSGRAFGGRFTKSKLAASISPGKSWEGVWGGMAGVLILSVAGALLGQNDASTFGGTLFSRLWTQHGAVFLLVAVTFLTAMSVVGDLVESLIKRSAGVKGLQPVVAGAWRCA